MYHVFYRLKPQLDNTASPQWEHAHSFDDASDANAERRACEAEGYVTRIVRRAVSAADALAALRAEAPDADWQKFRQVYMRRINRELGEHQRTKWYPEFIERFARMTFDTNGCGPDDAACCTIDWIEGDKRFPGDYPAVQSAWDVGYDRQEADMNASFWADLDELDPVR